MDSQNTNSNNPIHLLYPKANIEKKKEENVSEKKLQIEEKPAPEKDDPPLLEILKTLLVSTTFFIFFIFIGGVIIVVENNLHKKPNDIIISFENTDETEQRNIIRKDELKKIKSALENYYIKHFNYPNAEEIEFFLINEGYIKQIAPDPIDKVPFKYAYAVYDNTIGEKQSYILSASLEEKSGIVNQWTIGSPTIYHRDFRDTSKKNVTYLPKGIDNQPRVKAK